MDMIATSIKNIEIQLGQMGTTMNASKDKTGSLVIQKI